MKKTTYTIGSVIILLFAAFVFVAVPIFSGGARRGSIPALGKYNGKEIRFEQGSDFNTIASNYYDYFKQQGYDINAAEMNTIYSMAFNETVRTMAYMDFVKESDYIVPTSKVNRTMMQYFVDEKGKYSSKMYQDAPKTRVEELRSNIEKQHTLQRFYDDNFGSQLTKIGKYPLFEEKVSDAEIAFIQNMNNNQRSFNMAAFNMNEYPESEKVAYGKANAEKFVKYDFSLITIREKSEAEKLVKSIRKGEITFEDALAEKSTFSYTSESGKMNSRLQYQLTKIIKDEKDMNAVAALELGAISDPVITALDEYAIFKADGLPVQPDFSDVQTINTVYNYISAYEYSHIENYFTETAKAFASVAEKRGFNAACTQFNVKKEVIPTFPLNYGSSSIFDSIDSSIAALSGASRNENFLKTAFTLNEKQISEPIVLNRNIIVLELISTKEKADDTAPAQAIADTISNYDQSSATRAVLTSKKLVNNFAEVSSKYLTPTTNN